jgi:hypothetical protein
MRKTIILFVFLAIAFHEVEASQIESNHSYFKNSNFLSDYEVTVRGYGDVKFASQKFTEGTNNELNTDLSINFDVQGKIEEGFKYGFQLAERFNSNKDFTKSRSYFAYINNYYGKFEFGNTLAATEVSRVGGDSLSIANGGIFGDFSRYILNNLTAGQFFILKEGTLSNQFFGYYNQAMDREYYDHFDYIGKINYYSPELYGFQGLFSYSPGNKITPQMVDKQNGTGAELIIGDVISYGVSYINTFDNIGIAVSMIKEKNMNFAADKDEDGRKLSTKMDINSDIFGLNINYFGFTVAFSTGLLTRTNVENTYFAPITNEKSSYTDYGVGYEIGNIILNYNSFKSEVKKINSFSADSFSIEIKSNKNVSFYGEYIDFIIENKKSIPQPTSKGGRMALFGVLVNFY